MLQSKYRYVQVQACLKVQAGFQLQRGTEVPGFVYKIILMCREDITLPKKKSDICPKLLRDDI